MDVLVLIWLPFLAGSAGVYIVDRTILHEHIQGHQTERERATRSKNL